MDSIFKDKLSKSTLQRLHVSGSQPANFYALVKDHKTKGDSYFPLRPIASVNNTPTNKIDWLCSRILNQLVQFVPSHLPSSLTLIDSLNKQSLQPEDDVFVSLDVINLYPSVPITSALKVVLDFSAAHWSEIDNFDLTLDQFNKLLSFASFNYEIQFNDKVYHQIRGCPMGSHYAPPFAIIYELVYAFY